jgi:hypothetical protein
MVSRTYRRGKQNNGTAASEGKRTKKPHVAFTVIGRCAACGGCESTAAPGITRYACTESGCVFVLANLPATDFQNSVLLNPAKRL